MNVRERMKHKLKLLAGLPSEPTDTQLDAIVGDIRKIQPTKTPTEGDWREAAARRVPGAGTRKYAGEDLSDLNALLMLLQGASPSAGPSKPSGGSGGGTSGTVRK